MTDVREDIIARLAVVVGAVVGAGNVFRNVTSIDETHLPACAILEGDEEVDEGDIPRTRPSARPYIVTATPAVLLRVQEKAPGTAFNELRAAIIAAVLTDATLVGLSVNGRGIRYAGMNTTEYAARQIVGAGALQFAIPYALDPNEL